MAMPFIVAVYETTGKNPGIKLILYSEVSTPTIVCLAPGRPTRCVLTKAALIMVVNCSTQLKLVGSFQFIVTLAKLTPLKSVTFSVVCTLNTLR